MATPARAARVYTQLPVQALTSWTMSSILSALDQHDLGLFQQSSLAVDWMTRDGRLAAVLAKRIAGVFGEACGVQPARTPGSPRERKVARELEAGWMDAPSVAARKDLLKWGVMIGVGVGQLLWETRGGMWAQRLRAWHPQFLYYRWDLEQYHLLTRQGVVPITPGDGTWILYEPYGERSWLSGAVRSLAIPVLMRGWDFRDWANFNQEHAVPIKKVSVPAGAETSSATGASKDSFLAGVQALGRDEPSQDAAGYPSSASFWQEARTPTSDFLLNVGRLGRYTSTLVCEKNNDGSGYDLSIEEAVAETWKSFQASKGEIDNEISIRLLGSNLGTEVKSGGKSGSSEAAGVHQEEENLFRADDASTLAACLRDQELKPWALYNYGDAELAPRPGWAVEEPEDLDAKARTVASAGDALQKVRAALKGSGKTVDPAKFLEAFGVALVDDKESPTAGDQADPPAGAGADAQGTPAKDENVAPADDSAGDTAPADDPASV
jgi:phage gp29-like protein